MFIFACLLFSLFALTTGEFNLTVNYGKSVSTCCAQFVTIEYLIPRNPSSIEYWEPLNPGCSPSRGAVADPWRSSDIPQLAGVDYAPREKHVGPGDYRLDFSVFDVIGPVGDPYEITI